MRISDWSSDVCSSDLFEAGAVDFASLDRACLIPAPGEFPRMVAVVLADAEDVPPRQGERGPQLHPIDRNGLAGGSDRSEEHTSELQSLMRTSYAVFCLKKR